MISIYSRLQPQFDNKKSQPQLYDITCVLELNTQGRGSTQSRENP